MKLKDTINESWLNDKRDSDKPSLTKEQKSDILHKISEYNKYAKAIYNESDLIEIAKELSEMAENAEMLTISETEDQFDKITVQRNMKELKNLSNQFAKSATEAQAFKQRLTGLYEDMGTILNRYFDIQEMQEEGINEDLSNKAGVASDMELDKKVAGAKAKLLKAPRNMSTSQAKQILKYSDKAKNK